MKTDFRLVLSLSAALLLAGCGAGSETSSKNLASIEGRLVDAPVEGVEYRCGTWILQTSADGGFVCESLPVEFHVGGVHIGTLEQLPEDGAVTPQDLAGVARDRVDKYTANIALFLQSLDDDGLIEDGITIDHAAKEALEEYDLSLHQIDLDGIKTILSRIEAAHQVTREDAVEHLRRQMIALGVDELHIDDPVASVSDATPLSEEESVEQLDESLHADSSAVPELYNPSTGEEESQEDEPHVSTDNPSQASETGGEETDSTQADEETFKKAMLELINEARAEGRECGEYGYFDPAPPLKWSEELYAAALEHSKDLALSDTFSHTGSGTESDRTARALHPGEGSSVGERIEYNGYQPWQRYGENIAAGTVMDEAKEAIEGWLASPGHCKNLMKPQFEEVGMAVYYDADSHYKYYWTQDFGTMQ